MEQRTWAEVCARRMARHSLLRPGSDLSTVVDSSCGIHAQVMSAAELAIGARMPSLTRSAVRDAIWRDRVLVKTFGPRGTVHLLPAAQLPRWCAAFTAAPWQRPSVPERMRLTPAQTDAIVSAIADALAGAELTLDELDTAVVERAGAWAGELVMPAFNGYWPLWRRAMSEAAQRGALCFGPDRGRRVTYTNPGRWLGGWSRPDPTAALAGLLLDYLRGYGPATANEFAQWLGLTRAGAAELFASLSGQLREVEVDGRKAFVAADDDADATESTMDGVLRLLPYFDPYLVGCHPRELVFPGVAQSRALSRGQAGTMACLLLDGVVAGIWHARRSGRRVDVTVEPFVRLTAPLRRRLEAEVDRIGAVSEAPATLTVGAVTANHHL